MLPRTRSLSNKLRSNGSIPHFLKPATMFVDVNAFAIAQVDTAAMSKMVIGRAFDIIQLSQRSTLTSALSTAANPSLHLYTLLLLTVAFDLFRHVRTPRDVQSLSLDLSQLPVIICAIEHFPSLRVFYFHFLGRDIFIIQPHKISSSNVWVTTPNMVAFIHRKLLERIKSVYGYQPALCIRVVLCQ